MNGIMATYNNQLTLFYVLALTLFASMTETKAQQTDASQNEGYLPPTATVATGKAPCMKARLVAENNGVKTYAIVLAKGDEVMSGLTDFARQNKVTSASFTAIGAFSNATVAWFDRTKKEYKLIPIKQQVELISMIGDIAHACISGVIRWYGQGRASRRSQCLSNFGVIYDRVSHGFTQTTG
jgi:hypothetical protein